MVKWWNSTSDHYTECLWQYYICSRWDMISWSTWMKNPVSESQLLWYRPFYRNIPVFYPTPTPLKSPAKKFSKCLIVYNMLMQKNRLAAKFTICGRLISNGLGAPAVSLSVYHWEGQISKHWCIYNENTRLLCQNSGGQRICGFRAGPS